MPSHDRKRRCQDEKRRAARGRTAQQGLGPLAQGFGHPCGQSAKDRSNECESHQKVQEPKVQCLQTYSPAFQRQDMRVEGKRRHRAARLCIHRRQHHCDRQQDRQEHDKRKPYAQCAMSQHATRASALDEQCSEESGDDEEHRHAEVVDQRNEHVRDQAGLRIAPERSRLVDLMNRSHMQHDTQPHHRGTQVVQRMQSRQRAHAATGARPRRQRWACARHRAAAPGASDAADGPPICAPVTDDLRRFVLQGDAGRSARPHPPGDNVTCRLLASIPAFGRAPRPDGIRRCHTARTFGAEQLVCAGPN